MILFNVYISMKIKLLVTNDPLLLRSKERDEAQNK